MVAVHHLGFSKSGHFNGRPGAEATDASSCQKSSKLVKRLQRSGIFFQDGVFAFLHSYTKLHKPADSSMCKQVPVIFILFRAVYKVCNYLQKKSLRLIDIPGHDRVRQLYFDKFKATAR